MTERSAAYWLQVAVNERLELALPTVLVSEKTGKDTTPPYVELYDISILDNMGVKCGNVKKLRMTIRVFDESENSDAVKDIIDDIVSALTGDPLELEGGFNCYLTTHERSEPSVLLKDAKTWRGTTQFLFGISQTS